MAATAERNALLSRYNKAFVAKLSDSQAIAIYLRLKGKGLLK